MILFSQDAEGQLLKSRKTGRHMMIKVALSTIGLIACFGFFILGVYRLAISFSNLHSGNESEMKDGLYLTVAASLPEVMVNSPSETIPELGAKNGMIEFGLAKRASWITAAIDGAVSTFSLLIGGADVLYGAACSPAFLARLGVVSPSTTLPTLSACISVGVLLAVANFVSYTLNSYGTQGGWDYDSNSGTASKRDIPLLDGQPAGSYRHVLGHVYAMNTEQQHPLIVSLFETHAPHYMTRLMHSSSLYDNSTGDMIEIGYQFILSMDGYNTTVITDTGGHEAAVQVLGECAPGQYCTSQTAVSNGTKMGKRDEDGFWMSYDDWGTNIGYDNDWQTWGEFNKAISNYGYNNEFGAVQQIQPCTEPQCYGYSSKFCFAGGMTTNMDDQSAFVGEAYVQAYGGVDGQCYNG